jgi:hypothetical protein
MTAGLLNLPSRPKWWREGIWISIIVFLSIIIHAWCVWQLPVDYDEPVYLNAGSEYAKLIKNGDLSGIINFPDNREHPPLTKILYGLPHLIFPDAANPDLYLIAARSISALFGVLTVLIVSKKNSWAGLFFAFHSMTIKYSSQAYLEALPQLMILISVLALEKAHEGSKKYLWISSIALGVAGAAKYPYLLIAFVLLCLFILKRKFNFRTIIAYFALAVFTFFVLNPNLWLDPVNQIIEAVQYHLHYSQSAYVQTYAYPWYQQILFLSSSVPWHPQVFFFLTLDEYAFWIALAGLYFELREKQWSAVWFLTGIIFLLLWPTKWPQYTMFITPVIALIAGKTVTRAINWLKPKVDYWNYLEEMLPKPPKITWWVLGIFVSSLFIGKIVYEFQIALARQGWDLYNQSNSPLSSNLVYEINTEKKGTVAIATDNGLDIWQADSDSALWGSAPQSFTTANSGLNSNVIRAVIFDPADQSYWLGTSVGITHLSSETVNYEADEIGCADCQVNDIFLDQESHIWISTNDGIYTFNREKWSQFTVEKPGIADNSVLSLFIDETAASPTLWAGTLSGISKFDFTEKKWVNENWAGSFYGWGGVSEITKTYRGQILACTLGAGIFFLDGDEWDFWRNTNSPLISNTVNNFAEDPNHNYWFGLAYSTEPGGYLMKLTSNGKWEKYFSNTSGYLEAEPLDLAFDQDGRLWIATNGGGIQTFLPEENQVTRK